MTRSANRLAKLTRPRLHKAVPRVRLFALLEEACDRYRAICVVGPPGAGKTTAVASWLDTRGRRGIWYQVDPGDADLATFFHYLGQAALEFSGKRQEPLPKLTPEYLGNVREFSRRFFRELFARLPVNAIVVLDNYQEVSAQEAFHQIIADAVQEVPNGIALVAITRRDPPDCYARLIANEAVAFLSWNELRLSSEEASQIARSRGCSDGEFIQKLHTRTEGWAAGLTLLIERNAHEAGRCETATTSDMERVFDYFAGQIIEQLPAEVGRFLGQAAILPCMTVKMAVELTGQTDAARHLESMYRRHLFVDRRNGGEVIYQFHALFRAFLLARHGLVSERHDAASHTKRAGAVLERAGFVEEAVEVYRSAQLWNEVAAVAVREASALIAQGRWQTVQAWILAVPVELRRSDGWLQYWLGSALLSKDHPRSREELARAHKLFYEANNRTGQLLSLSGIIEAVFFETNNHALMDPWIPLLQALLDEEAKFENDEVELRAYAALMIATLYRQPGNTTILSAARHTLRLLDSTAPVNRRAAAAALLMVFCTYTGQFDMARTLVPLGDSLASCSEVSPHNQGLWFVWKGFFCTILSENVEAATALNHAVRLGFEHGLPSIEFIAQYFCSGLRAATGDLAAAETCLARVEILADPGRRVQVAIRNSCAARLAMHRNDPEGAVRYGRPALNLGRELGSPSYLIHWGMPLVYGLIETGALEEAAQILAEQRAGVAGSVIRCFDPLFLCIEARLEQKRGRESRARELVHQMFVSAAQSEHGHYLAKAAPWMPQFCSWALEDDVEAGYVRTMIGTQHWSPVLGASEVWPWPWRIRTLGEFSLLRDDQPVQFGRKVPRKPLALLQVLIELGPLEVSQTAVIDRLWPEENGYAAKKAFAIALHRLRALFADPSSIALQNGKLGLDRRRIQVDAWSFLDQCREAESALRSGDVKRFVLLASSAISIYKGPFLPHDLDNPFTISLREKFRERLVRITENLGRHWEKSGDIEAALHCYGKGLDADDLAEQLYQGVMRCHGQSGHTDAVIQAYRRLQRALTSKLGVAPSAESHRLFRQVVVKETA
jgi:LuxR family transcriptional regulator, maltose regulon positive regulatory protein